MYKTKNNVVLNPLFSLLIAHIGRGEARGVARGVPGHNLKRENVGTLTIPESFNQPVRYLGQFWFRLFSSANNYTHTLRTRENGSKKKLLEKKTSVQVTKVESVIKASITNITHETKNENHRKKRKRFPATQPQCHPNEHLGTRFAKVLTKYTLANNNIKCNEI